MALDSGLREILQNLREDIVLNVDLATLLPFLRKKQLVTLKQEQELSGERKETPSERNEKLITIITGNGVNAFDLFVEALTEEKEHLGHGCLAEKLQQERSRLKASRRPEPQPRNKKPPAPSPPAPAVPPKPMHMAKPPQQDFNAVKYTLSVQGRDELPQNYPVPSLIATDEKLMKQMNARLSAVEKDVKSIKDAVNNISLEEKLGRAIENIENKVDKLTSFMYSQRESTYYMETKTNSSMLVSRQPQDQDDMYIYATGSNEYVDSKDQLYDTVAEMPAKKTEHPGSRCEYDYATTVHTGPVARYMPLSNTNRDHSSDASYHYIPVGTIKQPRIQQVELVEEEKLAIGKNGEVWLAADKKDGSKVVIKKPISKEIFIQEKSALADISHCNVIRLIDSSITISPVLVFEYAEKGNLLNCLKSSASGFSILKLLGISVDVACGMLELEKRGIIHCDMKARSILVDSHFVCKVASFSRARCLKPGESSYIPPSSITVNVPVKWAAPEILSKRKFSIKSDVWTFAVLLSEVFSQGNTPYPNMDNAKVKSDVQNGIKMAKPTKCPNEVYEVMKCCFESHAKRRPSFAVVHKQLKELYSKNPMNEGSDSEESV